VRRASLLLALWCLLAASPASGAETGPIRLVPETVRPGGVAALRLTSPGVFLGVTADGRRLPLPDATAGIVLIGVDLDTPAGRLPLTVDVQEGGRLLRLEPVLTVVPGRYPVQQLTLPRRFTDLDAATLARVSAEQTIVERVWDAATPRLWREPFRFPLDGERRGSGFGLRRVINGEPRAPHSGMDIAAPAGTAVVAANTGRVALVGDHFFPGTSVILDHGEGLFTMYFHLQEALVHPGGQVTRSQPIGRVGSTGRSSGPHLHWGVRLHGARVDPLELLRLTQ
jgi:murein DD-endopeptidase MepM/ murein hydrolase activator NlpD